VLNCVAVARHSFGAVTCALLLFALVGVAQARESSGWSEARTIAAKQYGDSSLAAAGRNIYVIYGSGPIYFERSTDEGATFSPPTVLAQSGEIHETDSLAAEGRDLFAVVFRRTGTGRDWCCDRQLGDLVLHHSTDAGASWLPPVPLTHGAGAFRVSISVSLPYVHVTWSDFRGGHWAIYYRRSADGGATWEPEQRLVTAGLEETNRPQIAAIGKAVHIVWMDNRDGNGPCYTLPHCTETYYMRSLDGGATWGPPRRLTHNRPQQALLSGRPDIAAFGNGSLFVAYDQDLLFGQDAIQHVLRSSDGGETWQPPFQLGHTPRAQTHPAAAALGSNGIVAWFDKRFGSDTQIYVRLTRDSGRTWQPEERLSHSGAAASTPHVALTPRYFHIIWNEPHEGATQVLYRRRPIAAAN
jgi:hypothetical protein